MKILTVIPIFNRLSRSFTINYFFLEVINLIKETQREYFGLTYDMPISGEEVPTMPSEYKQLAPTEHLD